jgi:pimeloyl-ACP methyl ester carboxylesterase
MSTSTCTEQLINFDGMTARYYEAGEPHHRTILLLHGGFGDARLHWNEIMSMLADEYHLIAPDLPGYGQSSPLPEPTLEAHIHWVQQLMDALGIDQAAIIGNSFGGLIARLLAATQPRYVPALVLVNGGVIPAVPGLARLLGRLPLVASFMFNRLSRSATSRAELARVVHIQEILTDDFVTVVQENNNGLSHSMAAMTNSPTPQEKTPLVPVLLLWGEADPLSPLSYGERIQGNIPGAKLSVVAECGHLPHLESPEVFVFQIRSFFEGLDRRPR